MPRPDVFESLDRMAGSEGDAARDSYEAMPQAYETPDDTQQRQVTTQRQRQVYGRMKAEDLASRGVAYTTTPRGETQEVVDSTGQPLTNADKSNKIAYDSSGKPVDYSQRDTNGLAVLKDPYASAPEVTDKTGAKYRTPRGLPWQPSGTDEAVASQYQAKQTQRLNSQAYTALGGEETDIHHEATAAQKAVKSSAKETYGALTSDPALVGEPLDLNADGPTLRAQVETAFNREYGSRKANEKPWFGGGKLSPSAEAYRRELDARKASAMGLVDQHTATRQQADRIGAQLATIQDQRRGLRGDKLAEINADRVAAGLEPVGLVAQNTQALTPPERVSQEVVSQQSSDQPPIPESVALPNSQVSEQASSSPQPAAPEAPVQPESAIATAGREIASKILPAIGTAGGAALGEGIGGLLGIETGPGAIVTGLGGALLGGAAGGTLVDKIQHDLMGQEWTESNAKQLEANRAAHPITSQLGSMVPFLISLSGGGGKATLKALEPMLGKLGSRIAEAASGGARAGLSEGSQEKYVEGKDVNPLDTMTRNALAFGATALFPPAKSLLMAATGRAVTDAAAMTFAGAAYDAAMGKKPFDWKAVADEIGGNLSAFALQNLILGLFHRMPLTAPKGSEKPPEAQPPPGETPPLLPPTGGEPAPAEPIAPNEPESPAPTEGNPEGTPPPVPGSGEAPRQEAAPEVQPDVEIRPGVFRTTNPDNIPENAVLISSFGGTGQKDITYTYRLPDDPQAVVRDALRERVKRQPVSAMDAALLDAEKRQLANMEAPEGQGGMRQVFDVETTQSLPADQPGERQAQPVGELPTEIPPEQQTPPVDAPGDAASPAQSTSMVEPTRAAIEPSAPPESEAAASATVGEQMANTQSPNLQSEAPKEGHQKSSSEKDATKAGDTQSRIEGPALVDNDGKVLIRGTIGDTHAKLMLRAAKEGIDATNSGPRFMDDQGRVLTREQAGPIAEAAGQRRAGTKGPLQSEHLQARAENNARPAEPTAKEPTPEQRTRQERVTKLANAVLKAHQSELDALGHARALHIGETKSDSGLEARIGSQEIVMDPAKVAEATKGMTPKQELEWIRRAIPHEIIHVGTLQYAAESPENHARLMGLTKDAELMRRAGEAYGPEWDKQSDFAKAAEGARMLVEGPENLTEASYKFLDSFLAWLKTKLGNLSGETKKLIRGIEEKLGKHREEMAQENAPPTEAKTPSAEITVGEKVRSGSSPQRFTVDEIMPRQQGDLPEETYYRIVNDKTGAKSVVESKDITRLKENTPAPKANLEEDNATKGKPDDTAIPDDTKPMGNLSAPSGGEAGPGNLQAEVDASVTKAKEVAGRFGTKVERVKPGSWQDTELSRLGGRAFFSPRDNTIYWQHSLADGATGKSEIKSLFGEEIVHAAQHYVARNEFSKQKDHASVDQFVAAKYRGIVGELSKTEKGRDVIKSSIQAYHTAPSGTPENFTPEQGAKFMHNNFGAAMELERQLVQLRNDGQLTEESMRNAAQRLTDWFKKVVTALRGASKNTDELSPALSESIKSIESAMRGEPKPDSIDSNPEAAQDRQQGGLFAANPAAEAGANSEIEKERAAKLWKEKGTDSPFFKKWFGNSKAVKNDGKPMMLFTGQPRGLTEIPQTERNELPLAHSFLSTNRDVAGKYSGASERGGDTDFSTGRKGRTYRVYAKIENPIDLDAPIDSEMWKKRLISSDEVESKIEDGKTRKQAEREVLAEALGLEEKWDEGYDDEPSRMDGYELRDSGDYFPKNFDLEDVINAKWKAKRGQGLYLQDALNDSPTGKAFVLFPEHGEEIANNGEHDGYVHTDTENGGKTWIPFEPEQIKSATDNQGTFDAGNQSFLAAAKPESVEERESNQDALGAANPAAALRSAYDKAVDTIESAKDALTVRDAKKDVAFKTDAVGNIANYHGQQAGDSIRLDLPEKSDREAMPFVIEAGGDVRKLQDFKAQIAASKDPKLAKKYEPVIDRAIAEFSRLNAARTNHDKIMADGMAEMKAAGIDVGEVDNYVTRKLDAPDAVKDVLPSPLFETGSGSGRSPKYFTKGRAFVTLADAIKAGYPPISTDIADLDAHRVEAGKRMILQKQLFNELRATPAPTDGKPIIGKFEQRQLANGETEQRTPLGYSVVNAAGQPLVIHNDLAGTFRNLYGDSALRNNAAGRALIKAAALVKHGTLAIDTFHIGRMLFKMATAGGGAPITVRNGRLAWNIHKGRALLEYSNADLGRAQSMGDITKKEADYAMANRPKIEKLMEHGMNVGKVADNLMEQAKLHIPILSNLNSWIFGKLSRSAMLQSSLGNLERNLKNPAYTESQAYRQTAKEMNELFGNMQNQGLLQSKTLQDIARVIFLAPNWTESQFRNEARSYGQAAKTAVNAARGKGFQVGNSTRTFAAGFVALLAANQIINYLSRQKSTFENEEEGHKLDAWIPGGKRGFWFNPMEIAGEYAHSAMKYLAQHENPVDVASHIASNKLSPLARGAKEGLTGRDYAGRHFLTNADRARAAITDVLPVPLLSGATMEKDPRQPLGFRMNRAPGAMQKQAMQSVGMKVTPAQSPRSQMFAIAQPFRPDRGTSDSAGEYTELRRALDNDDAASAKSEVKWLLGRGKTMDVISRAMGIKSGGSVSPELFAGSLDREAEMLRSITPQDRKVYVQAQRDHLENAAKFKKYIADMPAPPPAFKKPERTAFQFR